MDKPITSEKNLIKEKNVLVIEDDNFLARVYKHNLGKEGVDVFIAENGEAALEYLKKDKPNLIILDLMLPGISGFDVLEEIKKNDGLKDVPIIVNTNLRQSDDNDEKGKLNVSEYLIKSQVRIEEVIKKVLEYL